MNVQITDERLIDNLQHSTFELFEFGSSLYGLDSENSDVDQVAIYARPNFHQQSFMWEHHTLQVASEEKDTVYSTLQEFVRNLLTGDSLYNFEIIHSEAARNSRLHFLYDNASDFYNFTIIRAYLGFARRDLKHSLKDGKRFSHAIRCYHAAEMIFNENRYCNDYREVYPEVYELMHSLKFDTYNGGRKERAELLDLYKHKVEVLREKLRLAFDNGDHHFQLSRYMDTEKLKNLDRWVVRICRSMWYGDYERNFTIEKLYDVMENGIDYKGKAA